MAMVKSDTLTAGPFQHTYANPGNYTVSLKVIDSKGCVDSIIKTSALIISKPAAIFSSPDTLSMPQ
ncbi:MAG: PKD domain-containing protein [Ferruginibacter sp.]